MASVVYSQSINTTAFRALLTSPRGGLARDLLRRGLRVETQAKRNLAGGSSGPKRIDTGRLRSSITTQLTERNGELAVLIGTVVFYARFVHSGTGLYGPRHQLIRPKSGRYLRFKPSGSTRFVYARTVRGMVPNRFLLDALRTAGGRGGAR